MSSSPSSSLYIFTTSQTSLPPRYPHPSKPRLVLPSLIHRTLHNSLDGDSPSILSQENGVIVPHPDGLVKHDIPSTSTSSHQDTNPNPNADPDVRGDVNEVNGGLGDTSGNYLVDSELTVKLHLVGSAEPDGYIEWIKEGLGMLERYKGLSREGVDTLLVGFNGVDYKGKKTQVESNSDEMSSSEYIVDGELERVILDTWRLLLNQDGGKIVGSNTKLGSLYSPLSLLKQLVDLKKGDKGIRVNALDTPDCHHLPKEYTGYAKENGVELWAGGGGEGSDPLPSPHLHNLLQEFAGKLSSMTGGAVAVDKLESLIGLAEDGSKFEEGRAGVDVRWVLSVS
uniref:Uncharacterized protein n=1 Tax=Kwoniella bestiolae CBS 10118 TaxID=1296100 RepID=A0A1B9GEW8_9TREE|nr:hypothetical protein I302_01141 [Kwoniella bestiolae CBS 10118]OCF29632.1 hypothetical protein I302_01141 [Kwoniella bestiolae CBS 10118]